VREEEVDVQEERALSLLLERGGRDTREAWEGEGREQDREGEACEEREEERGQRTGEGQENMRTEQLEERAKEEEEGREEEGREHEQEGLCQCGSGRKYLECHGLFLCDYRCAFRDANIC
jgi:hypothetical protein